eukprot:GILK01001892.1.p1 GENE.GILK01001892.1~~GILK01001892.1.p1  ORF type:complete len:305 (+),score=61.81 GILK01001892.1:41-916(+)
MEDSYGIKARELMRQADKKMKGGFSSMFSSSSVRYEEACDMYRSAANQFKLAKEWSDAAEAFVKCATCMTKAQNMSEVANFYLEAANVYKKVNTPSAVEYFHKAAELFNEQARFQQSAKIHKQVAELYEADSNMEMSIESYQQAGDMYAMEDAATTANQCFLKVADMSAALENYERAIEIYEKVASGSVDNALIKFSCKDYFFKSLLCRLASSGDTIGGRSALERYNDLMPSFSQTREYKLCEQIMTALDDNNVEGFTDAVYDFDSISKLDTLKTALLLKIKGHIGAIDLS